VVCIHNGVLFSHKKNEIMSFSGKWMELEISEVNQIQKDKSCMFSLICGRWIQMINIHKYKHDLCIYIYSFIIYYVNTYLMHIYYYIIFNIYLYIEREHVDNSETVWGDCIEIHCICLETWHNDMHWKLLTDMGWGERVSKSNREG
jgi:hypothetical protein